MLAPPPGRTRPSRKPSRILSKKNLFFVWKRSRDSGRKPGRPGTDNIGAAQFSAQLESNLDDIVRRILEGRYRFSKLRATFVPKPDSDKERVICIPTVRDRLVQKAIVAHLSSREFFPVINQSSFGFVPGLGPQAAIKRTLELRSKYDWCLKTDIQSFFDEIRRPLLKKKVIAALKGHSLEPLILGAIDCEVKITHENRNKLQKQKLRAGVGIRQGMPLSPLLANLALADFDREVERRRIAMVRYADDLVLFFRTKEEAQEGRHFVKLLLATVELTIPELADGSKTKIVSKSDPLEFLGREILFLGSENKFIARIASKQIEKIKRRLTSDFSLEKRSLKGKNFQDTVVDLSRSLSAYLGIYRDAFNFSRFEDELRGVRRAIVLAIFQDLFGCDILNSLKPEGRKFLGMEILDEIEPNPELDV